MSYRLVRGTFALWYLNKRHVGSQPDGDSLWFRPDQPRLLQGIAGRSAKLNAGGFAQLRFEGIDALELHFVGEHQHAAAAIAARDFLLKTGGFRQVVYAPGSDLSLTVRSSTPTEVRGHILVQTIDPYRRPVAFVYAGNPRERDGSDVFLDVARLNSSLNARLMAQGHVYPAYYAARANLGGLPVDLRERLTALASQAWTNDRGLWPVDVSRDNPRVRGLEDLRRLAIWPKLFRRLVNYFGDGTRKLSGFETWLRDKPEDRDDELWIIPTGELANLHDIIAVRGDRIDMLYWPEELVIVPR